MRRPSSRRRPSRRHRDSFSSRRQPRSYGRSLRCEMLEDRRMLSVAVGAEPTADEAMQLYSTSTALFVENQGQWSDEAVRYGFNGDGVNIAFTDEGLSFYLSQKEAVRSTPAAGNWVSPDLSGVSSRGAETFEEFDRTPAADQRPVSPYPDASSRGADTITRTTQFTVQFDGANDATPVGLAQSETRFNYFVGDAANHRSNVAGYATVAYENLYDGIDLHTFGRRDSLKYEFYVAPGADYEQIEVSYDGIDGLWIDDAGSLHVETELGQLVDDAPYIYQMVGGEQTEVAGQFALVDADTYTFEITGTYDPNVELVIDPDLAWSTFLGGTGGASGRSIAVDTSGAAYLTGSTSSSNFPTTAGAFDTTFDVSSAFVAKITLADILPADFDSDGDVDGDDFLIWQSNFGSGSTGSAAGIAMQTQAEQRLGAVDDVFTRFRRPATRAALRPLVDEVKEIESREDRLRLALAGGDDATWILNRAAESPRRRGLANRPRTWEQRTERDVAFEGLLDKPLGKLKSPLRV